MQKIIGEKITFQSLLLFVSLFSPEILKAQKQTTFYLTPHIGIEYPISKFENKALNPPIVSGSYTPLTDKWGIALAVDFKNKWNLDFGFERGNLGRGVKFNGGRRSFTSTIVRRGYFNISKPFKLVEIRKKKHAYLDALLKINKEYAYWAVFDINFLGGLSYGYIPPSNPNSGGLSLNGSKNTRPIFKINRYGIGAHAGIYFQFYKNNKKRLKLGITYQRGLKKRLFANWKTSINGIEQPEFQTFSRDSMLAIYVAYPIKLFSIKEKGTIKGL